MIPAPQHYLRSLVSARGGVFSPNASRRRHHRTCNPVSPSHPAPFRAHREGVRERLN